MHLSRDADFLNNVVNDPSVFPYISYGFKDPVDVGPLIRDEKNYFFANSFGGFLVINKGSGIYEIHSQFLPEGRGLSAILAAREAMEYMFTNTDCTVLITDCPKDNPAARILAKKAGLVKIGEHMLLHIPCDIYATTKDKWISENTECQQFQQSSQ